MGEFSGPQASCSVWRRHSSKTQTLVCTQNACLIRAAASPRNNFIPQFLSSQAGFLWRQRDSLSCTWRNLAIPIFWTLKESFCKIDVCDETDTLRLQRSVKGLHLSCTQLSGDIKVSAVQMSQFKHPEVLFLFLFGNLCNRNGNYLKLKYLRRDRIFKGAIWSHNNFCALSRWRLE